MPVLAEGKIEAIQTDRRRYDRPTRKAIQSGPLSKKEFQESIRTPSEGCTQELDEIPTALLEYALGMAERAEAFDCMVFAHTACTDPAERQIVLRDVHDRAVDGDVTRRRAVEHLASVRVVVAEVVEREWSGPCVHVVDGVIDIAVAEDRQDGAEDLLVRNLHLVGDTEHNGRRKGVR